MDGFAQLSLIAAQDFPHPTTPPWHADRRSAQGVRSTTEGEIFKGTDGACADPGTQNFPCHGGGAAGGQGHSQFKTSSFPVHNTGSLVLS